MHQEVFVNKLAVIFVSFMKIFVTVICVCRTIFKNDRFPVGTKIVGYARSALTVDNIKEKCKPYLKVRYSNIRYIFKKLYLFIGERR